MFVKYDLYDENGDEIKCSRFTAVCSELNAGRAVKILTLEELLEQTGITIDELENAPTPRKEDFESEYEECQMNRISTIGEILQSVGVDLKAKFTA